MDFNRIDQAMATCKTHLDATGSRNTEIESMLVGYLLAIIYAEFEKKLKKLVAHRASRTKDAEIISFCSAVTKYVLRSINIGDIKGALAHFAPSYKDAFKDAVEGMPIHAAYDNIVLNRHGVAHVAGTNLTFSELEKEFPLSLGVFTEIANVLGIDPVEAAVL